MQLKWEPAEDANKITGYALAVRKVARTLESKAYEILEEEKLLGERRQGDEDELFLPGLIVSAVVLTTLSAELTLKAWIAKSVGKYPKTHNLEILMKELDSNAWEQFDKSEKAMICSSLTKHANDFIRWRYLFENVDASDTTPYPNPSMIKTVEFLIDKYQKTWMSKSRN